MSVSPALLGHFDIALAQRDEAAQRLALPLEQGRVPPARRRNCAGEVIGGERAAARRVRGAGAAYSEVGGGGEADGEKEVDSGHNVTLLVVGCFDGGQRARRAAAATAAQEANVKKRSVVNTSRSVSVPSMQGKKKVF